MPGSYVIPPAGVTAASFFTPTPFVDPAKPPALLADNIDPKTGEFRSIFTAPHYVDAAIVTQFRTRRGSGAAVQNDGQALDEVKKNDANAPDAIRHEINRVLKPFVVRGDIEIRKIDVEAGETFGIQGSALVEYLNLRTRRIETVEA